MGLYIHGMEMPKDYAVVVIYKDGTARKYEDCVETVGGVIGKAIPVLPHGRLIDADARVNVQIYNDEFEDFQTVNMSIDDLLDSSWIELEDDPTIIPAEEGESHD